MMTINSTIDIETAKTSRASSAPKSRPAASSRSSSRRATRPPMPKDLVTRAPVVTSWATSTTARRRCSTRFATTRVAEREAGGITQHIGAYLVSAGEKSDKQHRVPRHARSRGVHDDARPRRQGHRRGRPGRRGRRRRHAADAGSDRSRQGGERADHRRGQQDRQAGRQSRNGQAPARRPRPDAGRLGRQRRCSSRCRPRRSRTSTCCSR